MSADGPVRRRDDLHQFISLILRCELFRTLKGSRLYGKYWLPDIFNELGKLMATKLGNKWLLDEVSERQRVIFESLAIEVPTTDSLQALVTDS